MLDLLAKRLSPKGITEHRTGTKGLQSAVLRFSSVFCRNSCAFYACPVAHFQTFSSLLAYGRESRERLLAALAAFVLSPRNFGKSRSLQRVETVDSTIFVHEAPTQRH